MVTFSLRAASYSYEDASGCVVVLLTFCCLVLCFMADRQGFRVSSVYGMVIEIAIALGIMHSSAVHSLIFFFFCDVTVGVGGSDERDQSAPTQMALQEVGLWLDRDWCRQRISGLPR